MYCYRVDKTLLWRIKQPPKEIGGTARVTYVALEKDVDLCKATDFLEEDLQSI